MKVIKSQPKPQTNGGFINPCNKPLTPEDVLQFPGCGHYSMDEATHIAESIHTLAAMFVELYRQKTILIDNQLVVNLNSEADKSAKIVSLHPKSKAA